MKNFYDALKEVYGPSSSGASPLLNADGSTLITDKEEILKRWAEHFNNVLNRQSEINNDAIDRLPQIPVNTSMDDLPTLLETEKAIHILSRGKAPGSDSNTSRNLSGWGHRTYRKATPTVQSDVGS